MARIQQRRCQSHLVGFVVCTIDLVATDDVAIVARFAVGD